MKTMKLSLLIFLFFLLGCSSSIKKGESASGVNNEIEIDATNIIHKDSLSLNGNTGVWTYKTQAFTGYAVKYHLNDSLKEKTGFFNGKKQGVYHVWFENGVLKLASYYNQNVLEGSYKSWWNNGVLASEANYEDGKKQGLERKWFMSGEISKKSNLLNDKEDGLQQAWLENGKLYVNYEAKNGRIFGMRRANSCYQLKDEFVVRNK
jgi:antitoxin component YwqK of YwqJK toxin-antitoxin module